MTSTVLSARLVAASLPKSVSISILRDIQKWESENGPEWTIQRLKTLKVDFIRRIAGQGPLKADTSLSYHSDGTPRGSFRWIFRCLDRDRDRAVKAFNALLGYTSYRSLKLTQKQLTKFLGAVQREPVDPAAMRIADGYVRDGMVGKRADVNLFEKLLKTPRPLAAEIPREHSVAPIYREVNGAMTLVNVAEWQGIEGSLPFFLFNQRWVNHHRKWFAPLLIGYNLGPMANFEFEGPSYEDGVLVGTIGFLQEPGFKLRSVANPLRILQFALMPLGKVLFKALHMFSTDATFDQVAGIERVRSALREGNRVFSFDLSSATDRFPLELQMTLLRLAGFSDDDVDFLRTICRGKWAVELPDQQFISWTVGQPLGLYPSFAMFALTHNALIAGICRSVGVEPSCFAVLGDDVAIWDPQVASIYQDVMQGLGCDISQDKSIVSDIVAEFAGFVVTADHVFHGPKWREISDRNAWEYLRMTGRKGLPYVTSRIRTLYEFYEPIPEPLGFGKSLGIGSVERFLWLERLIEAQTSAARIELRPLPVRLNSRKGYRIRRLFPLARNENYGIPVVERILDQRMLRLLKDYGLPTHLMWMGSILASHLFAFASEQGLETNRLRGLGEASALREDGQLRSLERLRDEVIRQYGKPPWLSA